MRHAWWATITVAAIAMAGCGQPDMDVPAGYVWERAGNVLLYATVQPGNGTLVLHAVAVNVGESDLEYLGGCGYDPWIARYVTDALGQQWSLVPSRTEAQCEGFSNHQLQPGAKLEHRATWKGVVYWPGTAEPEPAPAFGTWRLRFAPPEDPEVVLDVPFTWPTAN